MDYENARAEVRELHLVSTTIVWALLVRAGKTESVDDQRAWARATAAQNGWTLTEMFSTQRSDVQPHSTISRMISLFDATAPDQRPVRLLASRLELLGRADAMEAIGVCLRLHRLGLVVHTAADGDVTAERNADNVTPLARLVVICMQRDAAPKKGRAAKRRRKAP